MLLLLRAATGKELKARRRATSISPHLSGSAATGKELKVNSGPQPSRSGPVGPGGSAATGKELKGATGLYQRICAATTRCNWERIERRSKFFCCSEEGVRLQLGKN